MDEGSPDSSYLVSCTIHQKCHIMGTGSPTVLPEMFFPKQKDPCATEACLNRALVQHTCKIAMLLKSTFCFLGWKPDGSYSPKTACASGYSSCKNFSNPLLVTQQHYIADYKGNHLTHPNPHSNGELCCFLGLFFLYKKMFVMEFL